jgi:hypothetical protein
MTASILLSFLHLSDARIGSANRRVLFFVDKHLAHPPGTTFLRNIKEIFLPD